MAQKASSHGIYLCDLVVVIFTCGESNKYELSVHMFCPEQKLLHEKVGREDSIHRLIWQCKLTPEYNVRGIFVVMALI